MDDLDRRIINILETNGRASNARIARQVGVSEGTVRRRLNQLMSQNVIRVVALPDPRALGYESEALIGVQVDPDKMDQVADSLAALPHTRWVAVTTGSFDMFAWVALPVMMVRMTSVISALLRSRCSVTLRIAVCMSMVVPYSRRSSYPGRAS